MMSPQLREAMEPPLFELFEHAARLEEDAGSAEPLRAYREQVVAFHRRAKAEKVKGLAYIGMLLESGLNKLAAERRELTDDERTGLSEWPGLVLSEVMAGPLPSEQPAPWTVLHGLRRHRWFPFVPDHYVEVIEARLAEDVKRFSVAQGEAGPDTLAPVADEMLIGIEEVIIGVDDGPADATLGIAEPEPLVASPPDSIDVEVTRSATVPAPGIPQENAAPSGVVAHEEVAVLREALMSLREDFEAVLVSPVEDPGARDAAFESYTEQLQNLVNAAAMVGLDGFQQVLEVGLLNAVVLHGTGEPLTQEQRALALQWPLLAMAYLDAPQDVAAAEALAATAADPAWPSPAGVNEVAAWVQALTAVQVVNSRASSNRPTLALPEHVDLSVPADIDRNVLDSLLVELPHHAQEFSALVQRLAGGGGSLDDMEQARRVAHTLKGAGNTVGVKGVGNLTHALEDILVALGRANQLPTPELCDMLVEAADCLEAMSESLLANHPAPPESLSVHQKVLDWANGIDRDGLPEPQPQPQAQPNTVRPAAAAAAAPPSTRSAAVAVEPAEPAAAEDNETYLRVPASLIDSLLKLAGETSIISSQIQDRVGRLGLDLTALRGGSRQFSQLSHELEQLVDVRGGAMLSGREGELDALEMDQYNELHMLSRRIVESGADSREFSQAFGREVAGLRDLLAEKERVQLELQRSILRARMVDVASIAPRLQRAVRQAARVLGRSVHLDIRGEHTLVDTQLLNQILDPLMHMLRNAVDHGIEPSDERLAAGKATTGTITLTVSAEGSNISVRCEDDGRGLDLDAIRSKAASSGLIEPGAALSEAQVMRLILLPGFSTRSEATLISGRGVGMDVVRRAVTDLRGTLELQSDLGAGTRFDMLFPVQMSATQVMVSRSSRHLLALSVRGVEQILPAGAEIETLDDASLSYPFQGERLVALRLETLLGLPQHALQSAGAVEVVMIVRDENRERLALVVPELSDSRNVVVKPFNAVVPRALGVDGATILGDGSVATVLDLPDLVRGLRAGDQGSASAAAGGADPAQLPLCLIVDDSVSVRRTMEQLMQDAGYEVVSARDGVDALGVVHSRTPDIVLVDLEMPRMDGLQLTSALRNQAATKATPVVMITSRFTDRHRLLAEEAGVNAFLTKPYSEEHLLNTMQALLDRAMPLEVIAA